MGTLETMVKWQAHNQDFISGGRDVEGVGVDVGRGASSSENLERRPTEMPTDI